MIELHLIFFYRSGSSSASFGLGFLCSSRQRWSLSDCGHRFSGGYWSLVSLCCCFVCWLDHRLSTLPSLVYRGYGLGSWPGCTSSILVIWLILKMRQDLWLFCCCQTELDVVGSVRSSNVEWLTLGPLVTPRTSDVAGLAAADMSNNDRSASAPSSQTRSACTFRLARHTVLFLADSNFPVFQA